MRIQQLKLAQTGLVTAADTLAAAVIRQSCTFTDAEAVFALIIKGVLRGQV